VAHRFTGWHDLAEQTKARPTGAPRAMIASTRRLQSIPIGRKDKRMKAVGYKKPLPIRELESLVDIEVPIPYATGRDLLVEVKAVSVNRSI
jgi:hypothetical protein